MIAISWAIILTAVMSCEMNRYASELLLQLDQKLDHLGFDGHVERRCRLVENHEPGVNGDGAGGGHPLLDSRGRLVRVQLGVLRLEPDELEELERARRPLPAAQLPLVDERFLDGLAERPSRIEALARFLEDDVRLKRRLLRALAGRDVAELLADESDLALRWMDQAGDAAADRRLPRPTLSDEGERLSRTDPERHAVHGVHDVLASAEVLDEVADFEQRPRVSTAVGDDWVQGPLARGRLPAGTCPASFSPPAPRRLRHSQQVRAVRLAGSLAKNDLTLLSSTMRPRRSTITRSQ